MKQSVGYDRQNECLYSTVFHIEKTINVLGDREAHHVKIFDRCRGLSRLFVQLILKSHRADCVYHLCTNLCATKIGYGRIKDKT